MLRALEFYSGIGGMHCALQLAAPSAIVAQAFDINHAANAVYQHNFRGHVPAQLDLEGVTAEQLDSFGAELWMMAPPCQPFTRQGHQRGADDARCRSFLHLLRLIQGMAAPPQWLVLENVVGFEASTVHTLLHQTLAAAGYQLQEFILTPRQYGVPYSRPRYFCLASKHRFAVALPAAAQPCLCTPSLLLQLQHSGAPAAAIAAAAQQALASHVSCVPTIGEFLQLSGQQPGSQIVAAGEEQQWVADTQLDKHAEVLDAVSLASRSCNCFTKSYGQFVRGTGSLLATVPDPGAVDPRWQLVGGCGSLQYAGYAGPDRISACIAQPPGCGAGDCRCPPLRVRDRTSLAAAWRALRLRCFTPGEIARLHSFPAGFSFAGLGARQAYKLLGNSLSVAVVADLISYLLLARPDPAAATAAAAPAAAVVRAGGVASPGSCDAAFGDAACSAVFLV